jgi:hypothetical protein
MPNLLEILSVLQTELSATNIGKLADIITTIFRLSVPVTTRAIGRFGNLSLRSVERFYAQEALPWTLIRLLLFKTFLWDTSAEYLLVVDQYDRHIDYYSILTAYNLTKLRKISSLKKS